MRSRGIRIPQLRWAAGISLALVAGLVAWWVWGSQSGAAPARSRQYTAQRFCLLTPPAGLADGTSAQAWAGLEDVSLASHVQVRYLAVAGTDSPGAAGPFVASLVNQGCQAVVVSGAAEIEAAKVEAARFPGTRFLLLGQSAHAGNLLGISYSGATSARSATADAVGHLVSS